MSTKLTLTIDKEVIVAAKKYAKEKGQSLSELVENYFKYIVRSLPESKEKPVTSKIEKLRGVIKIKEDIDYKGILTQKLSKKYVL